LTRVPGAPRRRTRRHFEGASGNPLRCPDALPGLRAEVPDRAQGDWRARGEPTHVMGTRARAQVLGGIRVSRPIRTGTVEVGIRRFTEPHPLRAAGNPRHQAPRAARVQARGHGARSTWHGPRGLLGWPQRRSHPRARGGEPVKAYVPGWPWTAVGSSRATCRSRSSRRCPEGAVLWPPGRGTASVRGVP